MSIAAADRWVSLTLAVETGGVGNPPTLPPNPGEIPTVSRRGHGRIVVILVVVSLAVLALLGLGAWHAIRGIGNAIFQGLGEATTQGVVGVPSSLRTSCSRIRVVTSRCSVGGEEHQSRPSSIEQLQAVVISIGRLEDHSWAGNARNC